MPTPERFAGRVVAVTGATGIAAAAAARLHAEGASVFTVAIDGHECEALHRELAGSGPASPGDHAFAVADLRIESQTESAFAACLDRFGRLDGLFAVAGGSGRRFGDGPLDAVTLDAWDATLALNLTTTFLSMREAIRRMAAAGEGGSVVITSSVLATHPSPRLFATHAYAAAKGAQRSLVLAAAATYAPIGITVNGVAPSVVATPMSERAQGDEEIAAYVRRKQPLADGFLPADSVASAAMYLLSAEGRHVTGQIIEVDGGWGSTEVRD